MKKIAKLASIILAAFLSFGVLAFTACGGKDNSESNTPTESSVSTGTNSSTPSNSSEESSGGVVELGSYEITVLNADGSAAKDVFVQLCIYENGSLGACLMPVAVGVNGKVSYTAEEKTYEIHVLNASYQPLELEEHVITEAAYGSYTVTLAE